MELPVPHLSAVERLVELLPIDEINWALTGSVAHRLQGADVSCGDVDLQTDEAAAFEVERRLQSWLVEPVHHRQSPAIRSLFGRFRFVDLGVDIEVMGALQKSTAAGTWTPPTNPAAHRVIASCGRVRVPVLSLLYEADAYELIGRSERARLLRSHISMNG